MRGPLHGYVYLLRNQATSDDPRYADPLLVGTVNRANGTDQASRQWLVTQFLLIARHWGSYLLPEAIVCPVKAQGPVVSASRHLRLCRVQKPLEVLLSHIRQQFVR